MSAVLYSSKQIHQKIKELFESPEPGDQRVAIVAYVGADASKYLPHPKDLRLICNPEPGATSPDAVRTLIKRGAKVEFAERLHMKVYWSKVRGCVITSANVSNRALGSGNLKEAGVYLHPNQVDIEQLLDYADPIPVTEETMEKLEIETRRILSKLGFKGSRKKKPTYLEWYESPYRSSWKLGWWDEEVDSSESANRKARLEYDVSEPYNCINVEEEQVTLGDWLLLFQIKGNRISNFRWLIVDFVVQVDISDASYESGYPYQAVQVFSPGKYPLPPFQITPEFKKAFDEATKSYGVEKLKSIDTLKPSKKLLDYTANFMKM